MKVPLEVPMEIPVKNISILLSLGLLLTEIVAAPALADPCFGLASTSRTEPGPTVKELSDEVRQLELQISRNEPKKALSKSELRSLTSNLDRISQGRRLTDPKIEANIPAYLKIAWEFLLGPNADIQNYLSNQSKMYAWTKAADSFRAAYRKTSENRGSTLFVNYPEMDFDRIYKNLDILVKRIYAPAWTFAHAFSWIYRSETLVRLDELAHGHMRPSLLSPAAFSHRISRLSILQFPGTKITNADFKRSAEVVANAEVGSFVSAHANTGEIKAEMIEVNRDPNKGRSSNLHWTEVSKLVFDPNFDIAIKGSVTRSTEEFRNKLRMRTLANTSVFVRALIEAQKFDETLTLGKFFLQQVHEAKLGLAGPLLRLGIQFQVGLFSRDKAFDYSLKPALETAIQILQTEKEKLKSEAERTAFSDQIESLEKTLKELIRLTEGHP